MRAVGVLRRALAWAAVAGLLLSGCRRAGAAGSAVDFELKDLLGRPLTLEQFRGQVVLVDFWALWCVPCREEIPRLIRLQQRLACRGLAVLGLSMDDDAAKVKDFLRGHPVNYPVALADVATAKAFGGVLGLPALFIVDRDGRLVGRFEGAGGLPAAEAALEKLL